MRVKVKAKMEVWSQPFSYRKALLKASKRGKLLQWADTDTFEYCKSLKKGWNNLTSDSAYININGGCVQMSALIFKAFNPNFHVDFHVKMNYVDGNPLNRQLRNLRK
jgi:hypothetical protein